MATKETVVVEDLVKELKRATLEDGETATPVLAKISAADPKMYEEVDLAEPLHNLLSTTSSGCDGLRAQVAKCIADVAKTASQRKRFTSRNTIGILLNFIAEAHKTDKIALVTQSCRALGNICYLNDDARNIIVELSGDATLVKLLDVKVNATDDAAAMEQFIKVRSKETVVVEDLVKELKRATLEDGETATPVLAKISAADPKMYEEVDLAEPLHNLLSTTSSGCDGLRAQVAKCIADVAKTASQRKRFTSRNTIGILLNFIAEAHKTDKIALVTQSCRALGNICYLNDDARNIIVELSGDATLVKLLDVKVNATDDAAAMEQFIKVRCGVLSNFILGGEEFAKKAMALGIMEKLEATTEAASKENPLPEDLLTNTLPPLSILTENVSDLKFSATLNGSLVRILGASTNPDLAEMCLELLHYQAEYDDVKVLLAKEGLCETIYRLLEKYKTFASSNSDARALMKSACDLIVLILTGDDSMNYLYSTAFLTNMEAWLGAEDVDLVTTGVLALGNFARTDSHCIDMVQSNVMQKLLEILAKNNGTTDDMNLQHALLSTLRNLVIPKVNKTAVIEAGLVKILLPMLEIHTPWVVFKLLGTLRMTVDGQEKLALELLANEKLIKQLVAWSNITDHAGVTGESLRLMAWLIKHAYAVHRHDGDANAQPFREDHTSLVHFAHTEGAVESMVRMLTSQHLVMQNESLIALSILLIVFSGSTAEQQQRPVDLDALLVAANVGGRLAELISQRADTMTKEIVENLQSVVALLRKSDALAQHMAQHNIDELLKSIPIIVEYCTL
uniref:Putative rho/rac gtpase guanine nucleotide exchange factor smggds/vimar n=1 Tax=Lutzomyia longipalpis TaxID=7200 RepID=A0A1B0CRW1_LUTLO